MSSRPHDLYDVVIAGGGPAGTSAAIHLATRGARVLLAERKKFPRAKLCGEFISPECLDHFARLGLTARINATGCAELLETVFYARGGSSVSVPSKWFGSGSPAGLGLSRAEMDSQLMVRAREVGVEVLEEAQATSLLIEGKLVSGVNLKNGNGDPRFVRSLVTIDATGRAHALARRVGKRKEGDGTNKTRMRLVAFKAHLEHAHGNPGHCEIYFYRGGYGGLSAVENGLSNLCFIVSTQDVRACSGDAARVMREVVSNNRRAAETLADARIATPWLAVSLEGFGRRRVVPSDGLLAVGDAASFIDPFTGSGMLMALESGELAAETVGRHLPQLRLGRHFDRLASDYRARYSERFNARLRVSSLLRRAAFIPRLAETMIFMLGGSTLALRSLARATR